MQNFRALGAPPPDSRASGGWGLCPQTPSLRQLGASPPDPHWPPAAGGSALRPPKQPPHCEFLATRLVTNNNIEDHGPRAPSILFLPANLNVQPGRNGEFLS